MNDNVIASARERIDIGSLVAQMASDLHHMADAQRRIAEYLVPAPTGIVGTSYVATRLGCSPDWISALARDGQLPHSCIVDGTGNGKPWRFHKNPIDAWIESR